MTSGPNREIPTTPSATAFDTVDTAPGVRAISPNSFRPPCFTKVPIAIAAATKTSSSRACHSVLATTLVSTFCVSRYPTTSPLRNASSVSSCIKSMAHAHAVGSFAWSARVCKARRAICLKSANTLEAHRRFLCKRSSALAAFAPAHSCASKAHNRAHTRESPACTENVSLTNSNTFASIKSIDTWPLFCFASCANKGSACNTPRVHTRPLTPAQCVVMRSRSCNTWVVLLILESRELLILSLADACPPEEPRPGFDFKASAASASISCVCSAW
mmetsp:Transcript_5170/g.17263  ORF Transcript_5170/g.17263 Transcript_5170/m.17263 type:complete len:274 (+) Transcript_5170:369-1190(+)